MKPRILLHHAAIPGRLEPGQERAWIDAMPPGRAARIRQLRQAGDRIATLAGMALLAACARAAGLDWPGFRALSFPAGGKPAWQAGPDFSIAHAAGRVACALAPAGLRIGLDLERAGSATAGDLRLVASAAELRAFARAGLTATDLWVSKESVLKAAGARVDLVSSVQVTATRGELGGTRYAICRPVLAPGVSAALAVDRRTALCLAEVDALGLLRRGP